MNHSITVKDDLHVRGLLASSVQKLPCQWYNFVHIIHIVAQTDIEEHSMFNIHNIQTRGLIFQLALA